MNRSMHMLGTVGLLFLSFGAFGCQQAVTEAAVPAVAGAPVQYTAEQVERGRYLVTAMVCNDCHTPFVMGPEGPEPDMTRALSGHPQDMQLTPPPPLDDVWAWAGASTNTAFAGPWGISFAANLTPDENTGIGVWDEEIFIRTIRTGRHWGQSRPILPPMPWKFFGQLTDEDLRSIFAYLRTIEPIENRVPLPLPPAVEGEVTPAG